MKQQLLHKDLTILLQAALAGDENSDANELVPEFEARALLADAQRERASDIHLDGRMTIYPELAC